MATKEGKPPRCTATTAKGARCRRAALAGADICAVHAGAPVGRPTKLDDEVTEKILGILAAGGYAESAAAAVGIAKSTFHEWMDRGHPEGVVADPEKPDRRVLRLEDQPYREFRAKVERARAEGEARNLAQIAKAASKDWKAAAWILERTSPDKYAGPRGRGIRSSVHPDDFAAGESSVQGDEQSVVDDQTGPDGRPL